MVDARILMKDSLSTEFSLSTSNSASSFMASTLLTWKPSARMAVLSCGAPSPAFKRVNRPAPRRDPHLVGTDAALALGVEHIEGVGHLLVVLLAQHVALSARQRGHGPRECNG